MVRIIFNWINSLMWLTKSFTNGSATTRVEVGMNVEYGTICILGVIQVAGLKQLCKHHQLFNILQYFVFANVANESLACDGYSFLAMWTPVACSMFFCPSLRFWGVGKAFVEHPILVQKSSCLFRSLLWSVSFARFIKISHYWTNTDFNLVTVHGKRIVVLWRLLPKVFYFFCCFFPYWAFLKSS